MKCIVSLVVVVSLLVNCTFSAKGHKGYRVEGLVVVSERVGEVIDAEEREFFDLFLPEIYLQPVTYRYESAAFHTIGGGGYELRISAVDDTLVVTNRDPQGIEILGDYIDNFEEVTESRQAFEDKWGIVDYDILGLPITKEELLMTKKRMAVKKKSLSSRLQPVLIGAGLGGCVGGIVAYAITADYEPEYSPWDPDPAEGCIGCLEISSIALVYTAGIAGGATAGSVTGCLVGESMREYHELNVEDSVVLEAIKEARRPRVVE